MICLIHRRTKETATCETESSARRAEARGFERVSYDEWSMARAAQDAAGRERNREADQEAERLARRRRE